MKEVWRILWGILQEGVRAKRLPAALAMAWHRAFALRMAEVLR